MTKHFFTFFIICLLSSCAKKGKVDTENTPVGVEIVEKTSLLSNCEKCPIEESDIPKFTEEYRVERVNLDGGVSLDSSSLQVAVTPKKIVDKVEAKVKTSGDIRADYLNKDSLVARSYTFSEENLIREENYRRLRRTFCLRFRIVCEDTSLTDTEKLHRYDSLNNEFEEAVNGRENNPNHVPSTYQPKERDKRKEVVINIGGRKKGEGIKIVYWNDGRKETSILYKDIIELPKGSHWESAEKFKDGVSINKATRKQDSGNSIIF